MQFEFTDPPHTEALEIERRLQMNVWRDHELQMERELIANID